ncbi:MAG TPA: glycosyltransferase [Anaerolineae bacterium]|nr:glycosyltransferase [Anaerolineae bacterium]
MNDSASGKRVLVVAGDTLPLPGLPTTGAGLRAWGLGQGLAARGHAVTYLVPEDGLRRAGTLPDLAAYNTIAYNHLDAYDLNRRLLEHAPDVVVFQHWAAAVNLSETNLIPVVIDFHGPLLLETLYQDSPHFDSLRQFKVRTLAKADYFTCAGEQQRHYFYSWLLMAGFDVREDVIGVIPVSMPPDAPQRMSASDSLTFVYGGVFLPWQDPSVALGTLVQVLEERQVGQLRVYGGAHSFVNIPMGTYRDLIPRLASSPRVELMGMIPRDELVQAYLRSQVAVDLMARNPERELAFTTRTVEYLWCGLPVLYNDYAELANYIRAYDAGWTVDPLDADAIRAVLATIIDDPAALTRKSENARRLVRECLSWDRTVGPLDAFCRQPYKRNLMKRNRSAVPDAFVPLHKKAAASVTGRPRVLFISHLPIGAQPAGSALRLWELAQQVGQVADVTVAAPQVALPSSALHLLAFADEADLMRIVAGNDVVVLQDVVMQRYPGLLDCGKIMVYDLCDALESQTRGLNAQQTRIEHGGGSRVARGRLRDLLATGDFFLCASERQRDYWLGMLTAAGRLDPGAPGQTSRKASALVTVVPSGVSCTRPRHTQAVCRGIHPTIGERDVVLLWADRLTDDLDPLTLLRAMRGVANQRDDVKLVFLSGQPAEGRGADLGDKVVTLSKELGLLDRCVVFQQTPVSDDERTNYLLEADIGVMTLAHPGEGCFSCRNATSDYMWAGRPLIVTKGYAYGGLVEREGLGRAVPPGDIDALERAILDLADDASLRAACSQRVKGIAEEFRWDRVAGPLVEFCRAPRLAPDLQVALPVCSVGQAPPTEARTTDEIIAQLRTELRQLRHKPLARTWASVKATIKRLFGVEYTANLFDRDVRLSRPLLAGQRLGTQFRAEAALLSGIELLCATFGRSNSCEVVLHIQDSPDASEDRASARVSALFMRDGEFCVFSFPPIVDSANRQFYFWVDSPDAVHGDCVALFLDAKDNGLAFRPRYG